MGCLIINRCNECIGECCSNKPIYPTFENLKPERCFRRMHSLSTCSFSHFNPIDNVYLQYKQNSAKSRSTVSGSYYLWHSMARAAHAIPLNNIQVIIIIINDSAGHLWLSTILTIKWSTVLCEGALNAFCVGGCSTPVKWRTERRQHRHVCILNEFIFACSRSVPHHRIERSRIVQPTYVRVSSQYVNATMYVYIIHLYKLTDKMIYEQQIE